MRPEERIFRAIGEADDALLARCEESNHRRRSPWLPWAVTAAACLVLAVAVVAVPIFTPRGSSAPNQAVDQTGSGDEAASETAPPPPEAAPEESVTVPIEASGVGRFHSVKLTAAVDLPEDTVPEFYIFVDEEGYTAHQENGTYIIRPKLLPDPSLGLPNCEMRITHRAGVTLEEVRSELLAELEAEFETVIAEYEDLLYAEGDGGGAAPVRKVRLAEDGQDGVFVFTADYFLEATEGHGVRFDGMINTFRVVDETTPRWLTQLQETAEVLTRGILSNRLDLVEDLLTEDAVMDGYGEDVLGDGSVSGFDFTTDDPTNPTRAVVSVRIDQLEYAADFLTIELRYEDGKWLAYWSGIEK